jgi:hypothetical protein
VGINATILVFSKIVADPLEVFRVAAFNMLAFLEKEELEIMPRFIIHTNVLESWTM